MPFEVPSADVAFAEMPLDHSQSSSLPSIDEIRARLAAIVDWSDDAIVSKDLHGVITSWNAGAERMFGWHATEAVGRHITLIIPPELRAEEDDVLAKMRRGETVDHFETVRVAKDGRRLDISLSVSPIKNTAGVIIGASKIARDITERRRLENERDRLLMQEQQAREAAEAASRTKDELLATVSHELRTPLTSLHGYIRMLRAGALDEAGQRHALDVIDRNVQSLSTLIDDLLDLSRIASGRMRLTFETCDLARVVEDAVETVRPAAAAKRIAVALVVQPDVLPIRGAPDRLRQVVWNLLTNAVKFTPAGGHINVTLVRTGLNVHLTVADTGTGIGADVLPHVFEAFSQGDSSTTRVHGGLGLGLALVKHIVELHGGDVRAESAGRDAGATFTVTIPVAF